jgi:hypothetical protein
MLLTTIMTHELFAFHWAKNLSASPFNATTLSSMVGFLPRMVG